MTAKLLDGFEIAGKVCSNIVARFAAIHKLKKRCKCTKQVSDTSACLLRSKHDVHTWHKELQHCQMYWLKALNRSDDKTELDRHMVGTQHHILTHQHVGIH